MDIKNLEQSLVIFTDGSSLGNPGPGGYGAIVISPKMDEVVELGGMKPMTTNNEMELTAIVAALSYSTNNTMAVHIFTDSSYAIEGITKWIKGWVKNGWLTKNKEDVKNKALWQSMNDLVEMRGPDNITWHHVRSHIGIPGNECVDTIARSMAEGKRIKLYRGKLSTYPTPDVLTIPTSSPSQTKKPQKGAAYSYLAMINGELKKFSVWSECEAYVTGKKAKFKKALSESHEKEIIKEWGF